MSALPASSYQFRRALLDALDTPLERFFYVDGDTSVCVCPCCDGALTVRFAGRAPRADLECHRGCSEGEIGRALRRRVVAA